MGCTSFLAAALVLEALQPVLLATAGLFLLALVGAVALPIRFTALAVIYPWLLVGAGLGVMTIEGPTIVGVVLIAGGLFIAALFARRRQLSFMVLVAILGSALVASQFGSPAVARHWLGFGLVQAAVVLPATLAGHLVVDAFEIALDRLETVACSLMDEVHRRDAALKDARAQVTHAQKLELLGQFASGIAHDMNNALTALLTETSLLDARVEEERARILESAEYAARLTRQLMMLGRRDEAMPRSLDLGAWMRQTIASVRRMLPAEIALETRIPADPMVVRADPMQLLQVILNLVSNARDAMAAGGTLDLSLEREGSRAQVTVRDTGTGIPPDVLPRVFEPFFTTKPAGFGTGLGLSNVKQLIEALGGQVAVQSEVARGTTFVVRLPILDAEADDEVSRSSHDTPSGSGTVLVVDDDIRVRAAVFVALERSGFRVFEAASPEAALEVARRAREPIDVLLTDVVMPGGGGAATIAWFREHKPETRILVMSGYNADETARRGVAQRGIPFLAKPFTADQLVTAIDETRGA